MASGDAFEILKHNTFFRNRREPRDIGEASNGSKYATRRKTMTARQRSFVEIGTLILGLVCAAGGLYAWGLGNARNDASDISMLKQNIQTTSAEIRRLDASDVNTNHRLDEIVATQNRQEEKLDGIYSMLVEIKKRGK